MVWVVVVVVVVVGCRQNLSDLAGPCSVRSHFPPIALDSHIVADATSHGEPVVGDVGSDSQHRDPIFGIDRQGSAWSHTVDVRTSAEGLR
jgi:hypothetical protein